MNSSGVHVKYLTAMQLDPVEQYLHAVFPDGPFDIGFARSRLEPQADLRAGISVQNVPTLALPAGLAQQRGDFIIRVHLDAKGGFGEQKLDDEGNPPHPPQPLPNQLPSTFPPKPP